MNKTDFIKELAQITDSSVKDATKFYDGFIDVMTQALTKEDKVNLTGFGSFELKSKCARSGINPKTGEKVEIAACKTPVAKFSKSYKDSFN